MLDFRIAYAPLPANPRHKDEIRIRSKIDPPSTVPRTRRFWTDRRQSGSWEETGRWETSRPSNQIKNDNGCYRQEQLKMQDLVQRLCDAAVVLTQSQQEMAFAGATQSEKEVNASCFGLWDIE